MKLLFVLLLLIVVITADVERDYHQNGKIGELKFENSYCEKIFN